MHADAPRPTALGIARFWAGLSQEHLAERANCNRETVSRIEQGYEPRLATARALADVLQVPIEDLFPQFKTTEAR